MNQHRPLRGLRLYLEPCPECPQFKRLRFDTVKITLQDALLRGVHPWMGPDAHPSLSQVFLERINRAEAKMPLFEEVGCGANLSVAHGSLYSWQKPVDFRQVLLQAGEQLRFAGDLTWAQLLEMAKTRLSNQWSALIARKLLHSLYPAFQDMRSFLKCRDASLRLSSREELERLDLSRIVSLEDFGRHEHLLIRHAMPGLNVRRESVLEALTDAQGRLRLTEEIRDFTVTQSSPELFHLAWHVTRQGTLFVFHPDVESSKAKLRQAREFARQWRTGEGKLCFQSSIEKVEEMLNDPGNEVSFPTLNYARSQPGPVARAIVHTSRVTVFQIRGFPDHKATGDTLREVLGKYGVPKTGNKEQLLEKLARLAAVKYGECTPQLERFFRQMRVVRIAAIAGTGEEFPVLENLPFLQNLLLKMYMLRHLRGGAILEPCHENNACNELELARALLLGKVTLSGAFLRAG